MQPQIASAIIGGVATIISAIIGGWVAIRVKQLELKKGEDKGVQYASNGNPVLLWGIGGALILGGIVFSVVTALGFFPSIFQRSIETVTPTPMTIKANQKVLFDESHGEITSNPDMALTLSPENPEFVYVGALVSGISQYYKIDVLEKGPITASKLSNYQVLILSASNGFYSKQEIETILNFVQSGGRLFVLGIGGNGSLDLITKPFGVSHLGRPIASEQQQLGWGPWGFKVKISSEDELLEGVSDLTINAADAIKVDDKSKVVAWTDSNTWLDANENQIKDSNESVASFPLIVKVEYRQGKAVFFPMTVWGNFYYDNQAFILQALKWLVED